MFGFISSTTMTLGKVFLGLSAATVLSAANDYRNSRVGQIDEETEEVEEGQAEE